MPYTWVWFKKKKKWSDKWTYAITSSEDTWYSDYGYTLCTPDDIPGIKKYLQTSREFSKKRLGGFGITNVMDLPMPK